MNKSTDIQEAGFHFIFMKMDPVHVRFLDILKIYYNVAQTHLLKYSALRIKTLLS